MCACVHVCVYIYIYIGLPDELRERGEVQDWKFKYTVHGD